MGAQRGGRATLPRETGQQRAPREGWELHSPQGHGVGVVRVRSTLLGQEVGRQRRQRFGLREGRALIPRPCQAPAGLPLSPWRGDRGSGVSGLPSTSWVGRACCVELRRQLS